MLKQVKWFLEYLLILFMLGLFRFIPMGLRYRIFSKLFIFLGRKLSSTKNRVQNNLNSAFSKKDKAWLTKTIHANFYHTGCLIAEYTKLPYLSQKSLQLLISYGPDFEECVKKLAQKGGLLVSGHLGNVEYLHLAILSILSRTETELHALSKRQSNLWISQWLTNVRSSLGGRMIYSDEYPRRAIKILKEGNILSLIADQDAGKGGPFYPFMGRLASTYEGPAFYARLCKVPIFFMWSYRNKKNQIVCNIKEIERPLTSEKNAEDWKREFTYNWIKFLEQKIIQHPSDYFWLHKRWKNQPSNSAAVWQFWHDWEKKRGYPLSVAN